MRAFLHAHLLAGIKIVKVTRETYELLDADDYREKLFRLNHDLLAKAEAIEDKDRQIGVLQGQVDTIAEETRKECAQAASEQQKRIAQLEAQVNEVNRKLREELEKCKKENEQSEGDKKRIHDLTVEKEELEQKLADERRRAINEKDEINRLKKELDETKLDKANLQDAYNAKVRELDVCRLDREHRPADPEDCELILKVMNDPYEFDPKTRENG